MSTSGNAEVQPENDDEPDVKERLADLEEEVSYLRDSRDRYRNEFVKPQIDALQEASQEAQEERAELRQLVENQQEAITNLQQTLENMIGVDEPGNSTPEKRRQDLVQAMIRRAEAADDDQHGVKLWWEEVQDLYADLGHGKVCRPSCFDDMYEVAERPAFEESTKQNEKGNDVKALRLNLEELRRHDGCSDPTTQQGQGGPSESEVSETPPEL